MKGAVKINSEDFIVVPKAGPPGLKANTQRIKIGKADLGFVF